MLGWLERAMPHAEVSPPNPLFDYKVRRIRWGQTAASLANKSLTIFFAAQMLILTLWVASVNPSGGFASPPYIMLGKSVEFMRLLLFTGIGAIIILDILSVLASVYAISAEEGASRYDLLQLTNLSADKFIAANQGLIQVQLWPVMVLVISLRIALPAVILFDGLLLPHTFSPLGSYAYIGISIIVYVAEPYWRMRSLSVLGSAIASRIHYSVLAYSASFLAILILWVAQAFPILYVISWLQNDATEEGAIVAAAILCCPGTAIILGLALRVFYSTLRFWAWRYAIHHVFQPN